MKRDLRRKTTLEERQAIIRRRRAGEAAVVLASEYGLSRKTVDEMCQMSLRPKARLSRRQLNHYLELLGRKPPNVQEVLSAGRKPEAKKPPGKPRHRLTAKVWKKILDQHAKGKSVTDLAAEHGLTVPGIAAGIQRHIAPPPPLVEMTLEHLKWLEKQLLPDGKPGGKRWKPKEVRNLLLKKFGQRISLRTFHSHLRWMGVELPRNKRANARRKTLLDLKKRLGQENERLVLEALAAGIIPKLQRGRRKAPK